MQKIVGNHKTTPYPNIIVRKKDLVVIDAGIVNEKNLDMIKSEGFECLCVPRLNLKDYSVNAEDSAITITDNRK